MSELDRPRLEGSVAVRDGRRLSFAEFGDPRGAAIVWMHGTPGRPPSGPDRGARGSPQEHDLRIIGVDRPGHRLVHAAPLPRHPRLDRRPRRAVRRPRHRHPARDRPLRRRSLRAGGRCGAARPGARRRACSAEWRPTKGPDAISGGLVDAGAVRRPGALVHPGAARASCWPRRSGWSARSPARSSTATPRCSRAATRSCWRGRSSGRCSSTTCSTGRASTSAPCSPTSSCSPGTGASRPPTCRCRCTGGTATRDHIIPHAHGVHMAERLPHATLHHHRRGVAPRRARAWPPRC